VLSIPLELTGEAFAFVTLEDGSLIIEDEVGDESLEGVATVVERRLEPPYRARGFRAGASRWLVIADPVELADLGALAGEELTLVASGGQRRFVVDAIEHPASAIPPALAEAADESEPCVISASVVDEPWWELTVEELPREIADVAPPSEPAPEDAAAEPLPAVAPLPPLTPPPAAGTEVRVDPA
jgi:hypothetical protein